MSKIMFRVYEKTPEGRGNEKKWRLLAAFVWKADAIFYCISKLNEVDPEHRTEQYKIMHGNRNVMVFE